MRLRGYAAVAAALSVLAGGCVSSSQVATIDAPAGTIPTLTETTVEPNGPPPVAVDQPSPATSSAAPSTTRSDLESMDPDFVDLYQALHSFKDAGDFSTPLGRLCWAVARDSLIKLLLLVYYLYGPSMRALYPDEAALIDEFIEDLSGDDLGTDPVGIVNEEPSVAVIEGIYLDVLEDIQGPSIVSVMDDTGLSEELQVFAEAFFEDIEISERQVKSGGLDNLDYSGRDFENLPNVDAFVEVAKAHPDKCIL